MFSFKSKNKEEKEEEIATSVADEKSRSNEEREEVSIEDFIPYACHYNPHTILTKNGELLQVIKLTGFEYETVKDEEDHKLTLRSALRQAIQDTIKTDDFAIWFHTIRRKKDLSTGGDYKEGFAKDLNDAWCKRHDWEHQYMNELYVTILHEGQALSLLDTKTFMRSLYLKAEIKHRMQYLDKSAAMLEEVTHKILKRLQQYGARRLAIEESNGVYCSEILKVFGKVCNLADLDYPMDVIDASDMMLTHDISFGFNALEVQGATGRHFGTIMTVKEYQEVSSGFIDDFLQLPVQFVITETFDFVSSKKVMTEYSQQVEYIKLSRAEEISQSSGLSTMLNVDESASTAFGEHQITVMLIEDTLEELEHEVVDLITKLREMGILVFREDVYMEDCYWAQLPGNFEFIKRMSFIATERIGGYASLYNFPAGKLEGSHWGDAVTVFRTAGKTPYFFNFHYDDCGHSLIIGPYGSGKTVLLNFLLSEAQKLKHRLVFFDRERGSEIFIKAIGGSYKRILRDKEHTQLRFNPFAMQDNEGNRAFLFKWLRFLVADADKEIDEKDVEKIRKAIDYAYQLPPDQRRLGNILPKFWDKELDQSEILAQDQLPEDATDASRSIMDQLDEEERMEEEEWAAKAEQLLKQGMSTEEMLAQQAYKTEIESMKTSTEKRLSMWYGEGRFAHIFDNVDDELDLGSNIIQAFGLTHMVQDQISLIPVLYYLMYRINAILDGLPTIMVLDEAWHLIDNPVFAPHMEVWLEELRQKNVMVIFATESVLEAENSSITQQLTKHCKTQIYLPNKDADEDYCNVFGISKKELEMVRGLSGSRRQFLLRHDIDSVVAELDLSGFDYFLAVLSGSEENIALMEGAILDSTANPQDWLPLYRERVLL